MLLLELLYLSPIIYKRVAKACSCFFRSPPPPPSTESDNEAEDGPVTSSSGLAPEVTSTELEKDSKAEVATAEESAPATAPTATVVTSTEFVPEVTSSEDNLTTEAAATMLELGQQNSEQTGTY